jgi:hypothetical protein
MTKNRIKYFLLLSIILLIGYGQLFGDTNKDCTIFSLEQKTSVDVASNLVKEQNNIPFNFDYFHSSFEIDSHKILGVDIEIEEDEITSSKKSIDGRNYFSTSLYQIQHSDLKFCIRKETSFLDSLSNFTANKLFIIFSVFRI